MKKYITKQSGIKGAGKGLFTKDFFKKGEVIGLAHVDDQPASEIGRNHNHNEKNPTAYSKKIDNKRFIYASKNLKPGEEITTNYRMQPELEQPEDFMRKGGSVLRLPNKKNSKGYSRSFSATNKLFTQNFLFEKPKSRKNKVFDPNANYAKGGQSNETHITSKDGVETPIYKKVDIKPSKIHGNGLFTKEAIKKNEPIGICHVKNKDGQLIPSTILGMYNHNKKTPNVYEINKGDHVVMMPLRDINPGEELTADYDMVPIEGLQDSSSFQDDEKLNFLKKKKGGALLTKKVTCKKCGWKWDAEDGGNDITTCHKCGGQGLVHAQKGGEPCPEGEYWNGEKCIPEMQSIVQKPPYYQESFVNPAAYVNSYRGGDPRMYKYGFLDSDQGQIIGGGGFGFPKPGVHFNALGVVPTSANDREYFKGAYEASISKDIKNLNLGLGVGTVITGYPGENGFVRDPIKFQPKLNLKYNFEEGGALLDDYIEVDLNEDEIEEYRRGGYIVEEINEFQDGGIHTVAGSKGLYKKVNGQWQVDWNRSGKYQPLSKGDIKARTAVLDKMAKPVNDGMSKVLSNSSDNTRINNIYQKPLDWQLTSSAKTLMKTDPKAYYKKLRSIQINNLNKQNADDQLKKGIVNNENIKETVGHYNYRKEKYDGLDFLGKMIENDPADNYKPIPVGRSPFEDSPMTGIGGAPKMILQAGKWLKPLWTGTKNVTQPFRQATVSAFKAPLPLGKTITNATAGKLNLGNSLAAYFGAEGISNQINTNSDVLKSQSNFINNPSLNTLGDASFETGINALNFLGLGLGKQVIKPGINKIKGLGKFLGSKSVVPSASSVDNVGINPFKGKYDLPESYKKQILENHRLNNLKELNSKEANEVLENFKSRINTPEGERRMKDLSILYPDEARKYYDNLKIYADNHTYAYYSPSRNRIGMHPELGEKKIVMRHEVEHTVKDVINEQKLNKYNNDVGNFKYLFNKKKRKAALADAIKPTTDIDDILSNLELRRTPEKTDWNKLKSERVGEVSDADKINEYFLDKQRATNYFTSGSEGNEKSAFLGEVQQYMMDAGTIPKKGYVEITPEMVKNTMIDAMFDEAKGGKFLRLFNIMKASDANYNLVAKGLNKMLSTTGAAIGTGAALQEKKQGGATNDFIEAELTDKEIQAYRDGGYIVEEID